MSVAYIQQTIQKVFPHRKYLFKQFLQCGSVRALVSMPSTSFLLCLASDKYDV